MEMKSTTLLVEALQNCGLTLSGSDWDKDAQAAQLAAGQAVFDLIQSRVVNADHLVVLSLSSRVGSTFDAGVLIVPGAGLIEENIPYIDEHLREVEANAYILVAPGWIPYDAEAMIGGVRVGRITARAALISVYSGWDTDRALAWLPREERESSKLSTRPSVTLPDPGWCRLGGVGEREPYQGLDA